MRKIVLDLAVTLDGFIEGPNGEIDWIVADGDTDFGDVLQAILADIDAIFYGRVSYDLWGHYLPPDSASDKLKAAYESLHKKTKYVFTKSRHEGDGRASFIYGDPYPEVIKILQQPGKNIWLYGGSRLVTTFVNLGLIDIYRLAVHPVIIGKGKPLFQDIRDKVNLVLLDVATSKSGVLSVTYARQAAL